MSEHVPLGRRAKLAWGVVLVVLSLGVSALVYLHPEQLNAPAWVAYSAAAAFLLAGLLLLAASSNAARSQAWLGVVLLVALILPAVWVAFGSGARDCTISLPWLKFVSQALCRSAFGIGAALGVAVLALYFRHLLGRADEG